jgi:hypothetical protein
MNRVSDGMGTDAVWLAWSKTKDQAILRTHILPAMAQAHGVFPKLSDAEIDRQMKYSGKCCTDAHLSSESTSGLSFNTCPF